MADYSNIYNIKDQVYIYIKKKYSVNIYDMRKNSSKLPHDRKHNLQNNTGTFTSGTLKLRLV